MERVERRLVGWKVKFLSIGGRIILIQAVLSNLPVYFMLLYRCPMSVVNRLEKLRRDFLWQGNESKKKYHLVEWKAVCNYKKVGA